MAEHIVGCDCWHHQGGDYDRDCDACMTLAAIEQGKPLTSTNVVPAHDR